MTDEKRAELDAWLCPQHGIVTEDDLVEGRDPAIANASDPDGWTGTYYCRDCNSELQHTKLIPHPTPPDQVRPEGEVRLVAMTEEDAARMGLLREHPDNDLSERDEEMLYRLAHGWDAGITAEEARAGNDWIGGKPPPGYPDDVAMGRNLDKLRRKLRAAFDSTTKGEDTDARS